MGQVFILQNEDYIIGQKFVSPAEQEKEIKRFEKAIQDSANFLRKVVSKLSPRIGILPRKIIEGHISMLEDNIFKEEIIKSVKEESFSAEYALSDAIKKKLKTLSNWDNVTFIKKVQEDLLEIKKLILRNLLNKEKEDIAHLTTKVILVARDISPAQTISLDKEKVLGIITDKGGRTSHTAIIASSLGIPAVVGLGDITLSLAGGDKVILDGTTGIVIINPDDATIKKYRAAENNFYHSGERLIKEVGGLPAITKDGYEVKIYANVESPDEIRGALNYGADGVGLYRTEFLFLNNSSCKPSEEEHLEAYTKAISILGGKKLVIRTLDLGADKVCPGRGSQEQNPLLGTRAIRLCFQQIGLLKSQLRAILKVSKMGDVSIMFPMVSSLEEIFKLKDIVEETKKELTKESVIFNPDIKLGIMVEVPSIAIIGDLAIKYCDFMSIGTNDLISYSIAVDRANEKVSSLYQPAHPAILRLLKQLINVGEENKKPVSICGEIAGDTTYTLLLLGMGLKIFSMAPPAIPDIKKFILSVKFKDAKEIAEEIFGFDDPIKTVKFLRKKKSVLAPDIN